MSAFVIGFRVKSGCAIAVLVSGRSTHPTVADRCGVHLADPGVPEERQPYHAALGRHDLASAGRVARLVKNVERYAAQSLAALLYRFEREGREPVAAGIVVGSVIDPLTIGNEHIRAHAYEGQLFRRVVETAMRTAGLEVRVEVEKTLLERAAAELHLPEPAVRKQLLALGHGTFSPWRADEKAATLVGWLMLR
jgi:hypothetical protein